MQFLPSIEEFILNSSKQEVDKYDAVIICLSDLDETLKDKVQRDTLYQLMQKYGDHEFRIKKIL